MFYYSTFKIYDVFYLSFLSLLLNQNFASLYGRKFVCCFTFSSFSFYWLKVSSRHSCSNQTWKSLCACGTRKMLSLVLIFVSFVSFWCLSFLADFLILFLLFFVFQNLSGASNQKFASSSPVEFDFRRCCCLTFQFPILFLNFSYSHQISKFPQSIVAPHFRNSLGYSSKGKLTFCAYISAPLGSIRLAAFVSTASQG